MQAAQDRDRSDTTDGLNRSAHRRVLVQCEMRANVIVIGAIRSQDSPQMCINGQSFGWNRGGGAFSRDGATPTRRETQQVFPYLETPCATR